MSEEQKKLLKKIAEDFSGLDETSARIAAAHIEGIARGYALGKSDAQKKGEDEEDDG